MDAVLPTIVLGAILFPRGIEVDAWTAILLGPAPALAGKVVDGLGAWDLCCAGRDGELTIFPGEASASGFLLFFALAEGSFLVDMMIRRYETYSVAW